MNIRLDWANELTFVNWHSQTRNEYVNMYHPSYIYQQIFEKNEIPRVPITSEK